MALQPESLNPALILRGKHIRQMDLLGEIEGVEDSDNEAQTCRLAMLLHGEDPANDQRVSGLLDLPLVEYQDYVDDVLTQMAAGAEPVRQQSGMYHVPLASGDTAVVRPLKGRHRRLLGRLDGPTADWTLILAMSDLRGPQLNEIPIGDYQAVMRAVDFLFQPVLERLIRKRSPAAA